ncbi:BMP family lipoprotein [Carnobacterium gallinarum]|uniref:BMP family lipoprotein n=1 Tax=Carnobacterium gallinarum TaxID=2749 RepID=UPI000550DDF9|nr:BMP family protein [Carnobacterium gallinarum]
MKKRNLMGLLALGLGVSLTLAACGGNGNKDSGKGDKAVHTAAMVTDVGGVDDKSFNQSAWEGLQEWGNKNDLKKGKDGYNYFQSNSDSDFVTNLNSAVKANYNTVFGIGYKIAPALKDVAKQNPKTNFAIIDSVVEGDNVVSIVFKDNEAAFLAGVAAAKTTESKKLGFIGGQESDVISRFEAGFIEGVKAVDPSIEVKSEYAGSFGDPAKGKQLAAAMYNSGIDIIYQAAGDTGNGVFSEAKDVMKADSSKKVWVIGVDRDQDAEGKYDGGNLTLTSTLKGVAATVIDISDRAKDNKFPGGETLTYGLKEDGVGLTDGNLSKEALTAVADYKAQIIDGKVTVSEKVK